MGAESPRRNARGRSGRGEARYGRYGERMRAIWKGAITFGLVNVPVKLYGATEDHDVELHQVHDKDGGRIRYQRRCEVCGKVVEYEHIDKAYAEGSTTVVLTEDDLKALPEERSREIEVVEFVPSEQIDPIMFERSYFLEPDKNAVKAYTLLRRTLEETDRTAIVQFSLRQKTRLGALRVRPAEDSGSAVLMLQSLLWDDEVREADFAELKSEVRVSPKELKMSASLVDQLTTDFDPNTFSDEYQEQLRKLIAAKIEKGDALDTAATFGEADAGPPPGGEVIDLMEALRQSVERARASRTGTGSASAERSTGTGGQSASSSKASAKKAASTKKAASGKKAPADKRRTAKKAGAKKTGTGKAAAKKSA
jgi:DNA end-binding protein Ku